MTWKVHFDTAHSNLLIDSCLYELEFEYGTTNRNFANIIAGNIFLLVGSKGREFLTLKEKRVDLKDNNALSIQIGFILSKSEKKFQQGCCGMGNFD